MNRLLATPIILLPLLFFSSPDRLAGQNRIPADSAAFLLEDGKRHFYNHHYTEAAEEYRKALKLGGRDPEILLELAWAYFEQGEYLASLDAANEGSYLQSDMAEQFYTLVSLNYYFNLSLAQNDLEFSRRSQEEIDNYKRYSLKEPDGHDRFLRLGITYLKRGDSAEVLAAIGTAIRLQPEFSLAHRILGKVYDLQGMQAEAAMAYSTALFTKPDIIYAERIATFFEKALCRAALPEGCDSLTRPSGRIEPLTAAFSRLIAEHNPTEASAVEYYLPWFREMVDSNYVEPFLRHIYRSLELPENNQWITDHPERMGQFLNWADRYRWPEADTSASATAKGADQAGTPTE